MNTGIVAPFWFTKLLAGRVGKTSRQSPLTLEPRTAACPKGRWACKGGGGANLPAITIEATELPEDVLALLDPVHLDLGGTYGVPESGDPIQYDERRIEPDQGDVGIVVYNRAIPCGGVRPRSAGGSCAIPRATSRRSCRNRGSQLRATTSG